jgi:phage gpG-like protein
MSRYETVSLRTGFGVLAEEWARLRIKDFSPVMAKIRDRYMEPAAQTAWAGSGLQSRSGELERSITAFAGKVSAGVGVRTIKGRDLVLPKAIVHSFGRKKFANKRRLNKKSKKYFRRSPWGDIPARPFTPNELPASTKAAAEKMIVEFINDRLGRAG